MSRGGRGGRGRGGRRTGPDMSWQDEADESETTIPLKRVPGPMFPERHLRTPKPLSTTEKSQVQFLIGAREQIRNGPLYTVLESSQLLDEKGKVNARAGFDPFNDQERYTNKYHRKRRTIPDHRERGGHTLSLFPVELWPVLDPRKRQKEYWDTLSTGVKARLGASKGTKRKHEDLKFNDIDGDNEGNSDGSAEDSDKDGIIDGGRRRKKAAAKTRKRDPTQSQGRQKKGLDAEDDYPEVDQQDDDAEGATGAGGEDEPQDSEFGSDEDDDAYDDYNAENYFDDGAEDDMGDVDDDGGGGGGGGDYY